MNEKLDRRKKYTRMVLKDSLMELLKEKAIGSITIKEICERADINRSTFYTHYSSQYDLLHQIEEEIITDMNDTLAGYGDNKVGEERLMTEKLLEYVARNKEVCEVLLSERGDVHFQQKVMDIALNHTVTNLVKANQVEEGLSKYVSLFYVSGSIHLIEEWLKNGMDKPPKELAKIIIVLANNGLNGLKI
ncbi:hypothetical protein Pryu01_00773 [Paraliobacillus ryukyuensis]|uniref:TetR family transcriptional regulator n=1 Tax=Paraliobacillus ryukyuensis TaxID=200904 RepID=A0A366EE10_9BACI|nr:TetR/AcrR family transcriptional regulator [Paraliobacillus ryukyuensis]RBP00654.1 TetR family transcriptional regulator [Paraliobacillus ryukyuensis]